MQGCNLPLYNPTRVAGGRADGRCHQGKVLRQGTLIKSRGDGRGRVLWGLKIDIAVGAILGKHGGGELVSDVIFCGAIVGLGTARFPPSGTAKLFALA